MTSSVVSLHRGNERDAQSHDSPVVYSVEVKVWLEVEVCAGVKKKK